MIYIYLAILIVFNAFAVILVPFALPGNWLMVIATCLFAWRFSEHHIFSIWVLILITLLALLGEIVEFFAGAMGARRAGAGFWASAGAIAGALVGAIIGTFIIPVPVAGTLIGACLGAAAGTILIELITHKPLVRSIHSGFGAGTGQLLGAVSKTLIGMCIWWAVLIAALWP